MGCCASLHGQVGDALKHPSSNQQLDSSSNVSMYAIYEGRKRLAVVALLYFIPLFILSGMHYWCCWLLLLAYRCRCCCCRMRSGTQIKPFFSRLGFYRPQINFVYFLFFPLGCRVLLTPRHPPSNLLIQQVLQSCLGLPVGPNQKSPSPIRLKTHLDKILDLAPLFQLLFAQHRFWSWYKRGTLM